jgi:hypothetical protein
MDLSDLSLSDTERLLVDVDAAYKAQQEEWQRAYEERRAAESAAGTDDRVLPCLTKLRNYVDPGAPLDLQKQHWAAIEQEHKREWDSRRLGVERAAARLAYLDRRFRQRDFDRKSLSPHERQLYEHWLYSGPKPPPDPIANRLRWVAKLCAVLGFLLVCSAVALLISAAVVFYFEKAGFLAVAIYWFMQWRHW